MLLERSQAATTVCTLSKMAAKSSEDCEEPEEIDADAAYENQSVASELDEQEEQSELSVPRKRAEAFEVNFDGAMPEQAANLQDAFKQFQKHRQVGLFFPYWPLRSAVACQCLYCACKCERDFSLPCLL
jgi:hypothetical protein